MGKTLSSLLTLLALVYGGIAALLFFFQQKLTYYPQIGREIQSTPRDHGLDYAPLTLTTANGWTPGLFRRPRPTAPRLSCMAMPAICPTGWTPSPCSIARVLRGEAAGR